MTYREFAPAAPLAPFVRCLWMLEDPSAAAGAPEPVFPDGSMELVIHFAEPMHRVLGESRERQPRALLVGQMSRHLDLAPGGAVGVIGVRFHPFGAHAFCGFAQEEIADGVATVEDIWGSAGRALERDVAGARDKPRVVESFLLARLRARDLPHPAVRAMTRSILDSGGASRVDALARALGVSQRQVQRLFARQVGLSPKALARVVRFQRVLGAIERGIPGDWAETALAAGYYDQAHLANDFREIAGETPAAYARRRHGLSDYFLLRE